MLNRLSAHRTTAGSQKVRSVPLLLVHADNDPWIPVAPYRVQERAPPPKATVVVTNGGGHVGFHAKKLKCACYDQLIEGYLRQSMM